MRFQDGKHDAGKLRVPAAVPVLNNIATTHMRNIQFKLLELADLPLLTKWLRMPHVVKLWRSPVGEDAIAAKYIPRIEGRTSISTCVICVDGEPAGIIQADRLAEPGSYGIDLFIGESDFLGQSLGPLIIDAFVTRFIFGQYAATRCTADPELDNTRSVRAFEKAGFIPLKTFSENGRMHILLERRP